MTGKSPIGILGGTFDPIHFGHLRMALTILQQLALQEIRFIPCQQPVLKHTAYASANDRLAMLKIATADQPGFIIDDCELQRTTASYTIETLVTLRNQFPDQPLCLIIGSDALTDFDNWRRWKEIPELAHLIVVHRSGYLAPQEGAIATLIKQRQIDDPKLLHLKTAGCLLFFAMPMLEISSTEIRKQIATKLIPRYLLPDNVLDYIYQYGIYQQ